VAAASSVEALYRQHGASAVRLAYLLTGDEAAAHDIAHDAFLCASARLWAMHDLSRFAGYLRRTVVRTTLMRQRSGTREQARVRAVANMNGSYAGDPVSNASDHIDLIEAMRVLSPRQQAVIVLRFWQDMSEAEIATTLGCRPGTVKLSLARGLDALRKVVPADD